MVIHENEYILVFASHNQAVFLYSKLIKRGLPVELISTPCKITAGCSQAIKFKKQHMDSIKDEAQKNNMKIKGIYKLVRTSNGVTYQLI